MRNPTITNSKARPECDAMRRKGDSVRVTFYGVAHLATVTRDQSSSIVFLTFEGETRERWFHAESVTDR